MARQQIGKVLSGGVIVLCVIFLCTPVTHSQVIATKKKFVLSGSVGLPGVTMQGLPGAPMTDENGVYNAEVEYGWKGAVSPVKRGYTFEPKQKVYQKVTSNLTGENYSGMLLTFTVAGSVGLPGVQMRGLPGDPISDPAGRYTTTVQYGWSGNVTPEKVGYRFDPASRIYDPVEKDLKVDNYKAQEVTFVISGSAGVDGATMVVTGLPGKIVTAGGGMYRIQVPYGWSGKVTPTKEGHSFSPEFLEYPALMSDQTNQSYIAQVFTYQISGTTNMAGVLLKGLPDEPISDADGYYTSIVPHGWSGKVTPERAGYIFSPPSKSYAKVLSNYESQDYNLSIIQLTISGNAGTSGVTMDGLPGNVVSDATGFYTAKVEYGWSGTVMPIKDGWYLEPSSRIFPSVTTDQSNQIFRAERITFEISGNVNLSGVVLDGLPGRVVSGPNGSYKAEVGYKWSGKVTPKKSGYTFEPSSRDYRELLAPQPNESYDARIVQHTISGRIVDETGPVVGVFILADNNGGSATTDANGEYQLLVDHGWRGKITPQSDKYTFTPASKSVETVAQNVPNASFVGRIKMITITNAVIFDNEPFQGVTVTADPGGYNASTDAKGKYSIRVPYGWSGALQFEKEGFDFTAVNETYTDVTEDVDKTAPEPTPAPPTYTRPVDVPPVDTTPPTIERTTTPVPGPGATVDPERDRLLRELQVLQERVDAMAGEATRPDSMLPGDLTAPPRDRVTTTPPPLPGSTSVVTLLDVLKMISERTGVKIAVDATVKPDPVALDFDLTGMEVSLALQRILEPTGYAFKTMGDDTYLVFRPISNLFQGDDLRQALQDIALLAGVTIVPDPNVAGEVYAEIQNVPLQTALETMLAGSPFVIHVTPDYYLVADRSVDSDAFPDISETQSVYLNYIPPQIAVEHLSRAFEGYVKADSDPNSHIVSVTAPPALAERIVADLKRLDVRPRHVLLDTRVVVMERNDLLDVGVEWNFPRISAGAFGADDVGSWPWGIQIGYSPDRTFTDQLLLALNLLQENGQAEIISNTQVLAQDGKLSDFGAMTEEYYMLTAPVTNAAQFFSTTELVTITSGTKLSITPRIGDNNDITLELAAEVSDSNPAAAITALPVVHRRTARHVVTVQDGGTAALAGLTENRSKKTNRKVPGLGNLPLIGGLFKNNNNEGMSREIAVFVTAHLVREPGQAAYQPAPQPAQPGLAMQQPPQPAVTDFQQGLRDSLVTQPRR